MTLSRRGLLGLAGAAGAAGTWGAGTPGTARALARAAPDGPPGGAAGAAAGAAPVAAAGPAPGSAAGAAGGAAGGDRVRTGFERLAADGYAVLAGQRVGVVTNPTGITADARHLVDVLHADERVDLVAVFGPEHGFRGTAQAGGSEGAGRDPATGLPVYDTYDKSGQALADVFTAAGIDTVVFDIQDVGARFYTYIWTLYDCMRAAALAGKAVVVLDRPNPVGGRRAAGPVLQRPYASFVGREPIALAHGMTAGELAGLFAGEFLPGGGRAGEAVRLRVVRMAGWRRESFFDATGLPWVPPSPNMPTPATALAYAGTCLFEGTNLSEGRGTTTPFELVGAEGVDRRWAEAANALELSGVWFREAYFTPSFSKHAGKTCGGVRLLVHDREAFDPVRAGIGLLVTARRTWSGFAWRADHWIDRLTGSDRVRRMVDAGAGVEEVAADWAAGLAGFAAVREKYLLYP
ncbi:exo-beta-N-acetylmuramidase NamZ domain-containing protein [Streptomyces sp. NBC_00096]|uniref:exo-beta-N-acetylmuramidase NamZ family protein n=1 Tax=Streptomyces sp. NBC_00096 TaxID=2975650 RepID=UPI0032449896